MRDVIIETDVQYKLLDLKESLIDKQGEKKGLASFKEIMDAIDNLTVFDYGVQISTEYGIDCPDNWFLLRLKYNIFVFSKNTSQITILKMYSNKEDYFYKLFGIPMRSQESKDYWGE